MQLPYVYKIGITGHRSFSNPGLINDKLNHAIRDIHYRVHMVEKHHSVKLKLHLYTCLAEGADRMAVHQLLKTYPDSTYTAVLPLPNEEYIKDFASNTASLGEYTKLLLGARSRLDYRKNIPVEQRNHCYLEGGKRVVANSDVVIAVWNGREGNGIGGTKDIIDYCDVLRKTVYIINSETGNIKVRRPENQRTTCGEELYLLNRELRNANYAELQKLFPEVAGASRLLDIADKLAMKYQENFNDIQFKKLAFGLLATFSAATGVIAKLDGCEYEYLSHYFELLFLLGILGGFIYEWIMHTQHKWLQFRLLAEKLRVAIAAHCCGVNTFEINDSHTSAFIFRLKEEINSSALLKYQLTLDEKKKMLTVHLTNDQAGYHERKIKQRRKELEKATIISVIIYIVLVLFVIYPILLDVLSFFIGKHEPWNVLLWPGIALPSLFSFFTSQQMLKEHGKQLGMNEAGKAFFDEINYDIKKAADEDMLKKIIGRIDAFMTHDNQTWLNIYKAERNELGT